VKGVFAVLLLLLSGCYTGPGTSTESEKSTPAPKNELPPGVVFGGVYQVDPSDAANCCWLAEQAVFAVRIPANATRMLINIAVSDIPLAKLGPQSVMVSVDGIRHGTFSKLGAGQHVLDVRLVPTDTDRSSILTLKMAYAFVPKNEHINGDTRSLSVLLKKVWFK
jgi:hypothetical protein